jgi:hypothetical protein
LRSTKVDPQTAKLPPNTLSESIIDEKQEETQLAS